MPLSHDHRGLRGARQRAIIERCLATGADQVLIADYCGVDDAVVSRWKRGDNQMEVWHTAALVQRFGSAVVFGVVESPPRVDIMSQALDLLSHAPSALADIITDVRDGRVDERAKHLPLLRAIAAGVALLDHAITVAP